MTAEECDPHDWYHDGVMARVDGCICRTCGTRAGPPPARTWVDRPWDDPEATRRRLGRCPTRGRYDTRYR